MQKQHDIDATTRFFHIHGSLEIHVFWNMCMANAFKRMGWPTLLDYEEASTSNTSEADDDLPNWGAGAATGRAHV